MRSLAGRRIEAWRDSIGSFSSTTSDPKPLRVYRQSHGRIAGRCCETLGLPLDPEVPFTALGGGSRRGGESRSQVLDCESCRRSQLCFLMKIPDRPPSVAKIFRFHLEHAGPYLHFRRGSTYSLLWRAGLLGTVVPTVHGVLRISPSHEAALGAEGKLDELQKMRYRVRPAPPATAPLVAVWMEFVPGRRLSRDDTTWACPCARKGSRAAWTRFMTEASFR